MMRQRKRRVMNQINVVPYIDVTLVLLVIFMVTAPMVNPGVVNLPTVGGAKVQTLPALQAPAAAAGPLRRLLLLIAQAVRPASRPPVSLPS